MLIQMKQTKYKLSPCYHEERLMLCLNTWTNDKSNTRLWGSALATSTTAQITNKPAPFYPLQKSICSIWTISLPWTQCHWAMTNIIKNSFKKQCAQCSKKDVMLPWLVQKVLLIEKEYDNMYILHNCHKPWLNNQSIEHIDIELYTPFLIIPSLAII